jgi:hypothetical protein
MPARRATVLPRVDPADARPGDVLEVRGIPGASPRKGLVEEVLGEGRHRHFRVRWDEQHVSLFFPGSGEGVHLHRP